ncbi:MAG: NAD(P)-dependent oxidoreductase, partial [Nanoarchaeota archaeon]
KWVYGTADRDSFVSIDKIKKQLGWKPKYSNTDALIRSYQWYLDHKSELSGTGVTHRVAWSQGALSLVKKIM